MTEDAARLLKEAQEDPQDPDEVWQSIQDITGDVEWDLQQMLLRGPQDDEQ